MTCNTGRRKVFADELVASISELAKKHGLEEVVVHRDADPVLVAARGCLRDEKGGDGEKIELVMQISSNIARAEQRSIIGAQTTTEPGVDIAHAFDLSEAVAKDTVAHAAEPEDDDECKTEDRSPSR